MTLKRRDGRAADEFRPMQFNRGFTPNVPGSVLVVSGQTKLLCTVGIQDQVPPWLYGRGGGWLTAEYSMLPGSTRPRKTREGRTGRGSDGRSLEIQRLVGRALRSSLDLSILPEVTLWVDCDVLSADGGTRTTAVNGAAVALHDALLNMDATKALSRWPMSGMVAATSVGLLKGKPLVDLDFQEDSAADVDLNVVCSADGRLVEVQGSAERSPFTADQLMEMLAVAQSSCARIAELQKEALGI
jgi:ribonuclease PH